MPAATSFLDIFGLRFPRSCAAIAGAAVAEGLNVNVGSIALLTVWLQVCRHS